MSAPWASPAAASVSSTSFRAVASANSLPCACGSSHSAVPMTSCARSYSKTRTLSKQNSTPATPPSRGFSVSRSPGRPGCGMSLGREEATTRPAAIRSWTTPLIVDGATPASTINGQYACENTDILGVLKNQWHFPGFVTSDWGATHSTVPSALAGLDMEMPGGTLLGPDYYGPPLKAAVQGGQVPVSALNGMVSRILTEMFRFGMFDHPPAGSLTATVTTPEHARTGRDVAEAGTVLLKDNGGVLPLSAHQSIAVIGSDAGSYALTSGGGSAGVIAPYVVTPVQGITQRAARSGTSVSYAQGDIPAQGALTTVPASAFPGGLTATYYNNTTFSGTPAATGTVLDVALSWGGKSPAPGVDLGSRSVRRGSDR